MSGAKSCAIDGCEKSREKRGWCGMHYMRWIRTGDTSDSQSYFLGRPEEAFAARTERHPNGCLMWTGSVIKSGYGMMRAHGEHRYAHRYAWERINGPLPEGVDLDHTCWNRSCVEITHLRPATRKQNLENLSGANANSKTGVRGVYWDKKSEKWRTQVVHHYRKISAGMFDSIEEATQAVVELRAKLYTHSQN